MTEHDQPTGDDIWNGQPARNWVAHEEILDTLMGAVSARLLARADPRPGERVLDIGCGTARTTRLLADAVGAGGRVTGVDISTPMLERARALTADLDNVAFVQADAQTHAFAPESADLVVSRFGVMFFADPVAAFSNLRRALDPAGRIAFAAWAELSENPWFAIPREIAVARLGAPAPQPPEAPGPMAFADRERVRGILSAAGFAAIEAEAEPVDLVWPGPLGTLVDLATRLGPAAYLLRERGGGPDDEAAIREDLAAALSRFAARDGLCIPALVNFFAARRG